MASKSKGTKNKIERIRVGDEVSPCYARIVKYGNLVFIAGIGGRDLSADEKYVKNGVEIVKMSEKGYPPTIEEQVELVFKRWPELLAKAGTDLDHIIQSRLFLTDIRDMEKVVSVAERYWSKNPPTLQVYGGVQFGRPNMRMEFEIIAAIPDEE